MTYTILYIVLAAVIAFMMAFFQYFYNVKHRTVDKLLLAILRGLSIFSIILLIINPSIKSQQFEDISPVLNVLIDNSSSINYADQQEEVQKLKDEISTNTEINKKFTVNYYSFSDDLNPLDSLSFDKPRTNIIKTLKSLESFNNDGISPVILITDGNQTYGSSYEFYKSNQPLYPIIVGDTVKYDDIKINQINVNSYTYLNNKFPVEVFLQYDGNDRVQKKFNVKHNGKTVYTKYLNFSSDQNSQKIQFYLPATTVGMLKYQCDIATLDNEKNTLNNLKNFTVEVVNENAKVLILSKTNHPDISMIKRSIEMNKQRKVIIEKDLNKTHQLRDYQLVILYQPTKEFKEIFKTLKEVNFFIITGTQTDWNFLNTSQQYFSKNNIRKTENYSAVFNTSYDEFITNDLGYRNFPPLEDYFGEINFSVRHKTILFQNVANINTEEPLLATFTDNNRRGAVLFGENSWKWRMLTKVENQTFEKFDIFFNKLIQFLASSKRSNQLEIAYDPFIYSNTDAIIKAQYFDATYTFDPNASLLLSISNTATGETNKFPFTLINNSFEISLSNLKPGDYTFNVSVGSNNISKNGTIKVLPYEIEQQFVRGNMNDLKNIAQLSKGANFHINKVDELFSLILSDKRYTTIQRSTEKIVSLIERKWLLILIVLLLSLEWFIRKYKGLT
jgi:hypothetical protein